MTDDMEGELVVEVEWLAAGDPEDPIEVAYSYTCDAGDCEKETVMIIKTVRRPPEVVVNDPTTFWLSVCRQHSKEEMDYASDMLGNLYVVVIRPDLATTEIVENP